MSVYAFVFVGITPIASFSVGTVAEWFGASAPYAVGGGLGLLGVLALTVLWTRGWGRARSLAEV